MSPERVEANVELKSGRLLEGWAWMPGDPARHLTVELYVKDRLVTAVVADQWRADLARYAKGDGAYGFSLDLPRLISGGPHQFTVRLAGLGEVLGNLTAGPFSKDGEIELPGYLDSQAEGDLLAALPLEHLAYNAVWISANRLQPRLVNRLRRERQVLGLEHNGAATLLPIGDDAGTRRGLEAWSLQSYPKTAALAPRPSLEALRSAAAASNYVYFVRGNDVLHPSTAGIVVRLPDAPDVVTWNRFAGDEARGGASGTLFRRPEFDAVTARHGTLTDTSLSLKGALLAKAPEAVLQALLAGRLHPLYVWLSTLQGMSWHHHPEALTIGSWEMPSREEIRRDRPVLEALVATLAEEFTLEATPADRPFPYVMMPARRARRVSVLISYRDRATLTLECLASLARQRLSGELEVILVDNESEAAEADQIREGALELFGADRAKFVRYDKPFNHSAQNNLAAETASGEVIVICNNDITLVTSETLEHLGAFALLPHVGTVGCRIENIDRKGGSYGHIFAARGDDPFISPLRENADPTYADYVHASPGNTLALAAMERGRFLALGGLNARQFPIGYNDVEFMLRASKAGLTHLYLGHVSASHRRGSSRTGDNEDLQALWAGQNYPVEANRRFRQLSKERVGQGAATKK